LNTPARDRPRIGFWVSAWLPVLIAIAVIATESTEYFGADRTSGPLRWLFEHLFGKVKESSWLEIHHLVRKTGHFLGYGLVAITWLRAWWMTLPRAGFFPNAFLALVGTALIASGDEFHQSFLPNRTSSAWDVLLDCTGAVALELLAFLVVRVLRPAPLERAA